jgi:hypothetical protein
MLEMLKNIPGMTWTPEIPVKFADHTVAQIKQKLLPIKTIPVMNQRV